MISCKRLDTEYGMHGDQRTLSVGANNETEVQ
jgi:hypothetical protein